ncbi:MAG: hypothetical protein ACREOK_08275 [Gemmatimonadaceae bacterium]
MRRTSSRIVFVVSFATTILTGACSDGTATPDENFTLALSTTSLTLAQGASEQVSLTIQRDNFEKPIALSAEGLPPGVTATFGASTLPAASSATTMNVTVAGNTAPTTSASFTVRAVGEGVADQTQTVTLSVGVTGTYTLGLLEPELSVAQGGGGNATVLVTRSGGNAGDVSLSVGTPPAGVTATFAQATTTSGAAALIITASASVAAGTYPITITSSSPGHTPNQTAQLSLQVGSPPSTSSATIRLSCSSLAWFAFRNEGYLWQQGTPTGGAYTFQATDRVAIAYVFGAGQGSLLIVEHLTRAELDALADLDCGGTRSYTGSVAGLSAGQSALVSMGSVGPELVDAGNSGFELSNLNEAMLDLVATRGILTEVGPDQFFTPDRVILRRDIDLPSGSSIPVLDFTASESFAPATTTLTIAGTQAGEQLILQHLFETATTDVGFLQLSGPTGSTTTLSSVPADKLVSTDLHELLVQAFQSTGLAGRLLIDYATAPMDRTVTLGPPIAAPSVTTLTTAPYVRLRATVPVQAEYPGMMQVTLRQFTLGGQNRVILAVTAGYLAGAATWDITVPEMTGTSGFDANWMMTPGSFDVLVEAISDIALIYRGVPAAGLTHRIAYQQQAAQSGAALRAGASRGPGRRIPTAFSRTRLPPEPQYFRR